MVEVSDAGRLLPEHEFLAALMRIPLILWLFVVNLVWWLRLVTTKACSLLYALFLLLIAVKGLAQTPIPPHLEALTIDDGLSQGYVSSMVQDKKGFMWFATSDGLNKYDGYTFTVYHHNPNDTTSIASDNLSFVFEDSQERLWIGTRNSGLDLFDREHGVFTHFRHTGANSIRSDNIYQITEDQTGGLWVRTDQGIDRLEIRKEKPALKKRSQSNFHATHTLWFTPIYADAAFETEKGKYEPPEIFVDSRNRVLLTTNHKIWEVKFNRARRSYRLEQRFAFPVIDSAHIARLIEDTVQHTLFLNTKELIRFRDYDFKVPQKIGNYTLSGAPWTIDKAQRLWQLYSNGILRIGTRSGSTEYTFLEDPVQARALTFGTVCYTDRTGVVWIATGGYGILKYDPERERFHHILPQQYFYQLLEGEDGNIITDNLQSVSIKKGSQSLLDPLWTRRYLKKVRK